MLFGQVCLADVQINSYKNKYFWKDEWTAHLKEELSKDEYKTGPDALLNINIDQLNLNDLSCSGYNKASLEDKSDFWVVFFSALTRAESAFNPNAISPKSKGPRSYGLLQLAKLTAKNKCKIEASAKSSNDEILNPKENLACGLKLMNWQLQGAPVGGDKKLRADLEGQLFGKNIFQWGPLRQNDHRGRALLINWFKDHLGQMKFCNG